MRHSGASWAGGQGAACRVAPGPASAAARSPGRAPDRRAAAAWPWLAGLPPCSPNACLRASWDARPCPWDARVLSSVAAAACRPRSPCGQGEPRPRPLLRDLCVGHEPSARDSWPDLAQGAPRSPRAARSVPAPCVPAIFRGGGVRASRPSAVLGPGLRPRPAAASAHRGARGARGLASVVPRRRWVSVTSPARSQIRAGCWEEATRRRHGRVLCSSPAGRAAFPQHVQCGRSSGAHGAVCRAVARPLCLSVLGRFQTRVLRSP